MSIPVGNIVQGCNSMFPPGGWYTKHLKLTSSDELKCNWVLAFMFAPKLPQFSSGRLKVLNHIKRTKKEPSKILIFG